ncbi:rhodanese-like domain-containing protein [Desulfobulbus alkaliphilus]|uniref:rhodanese-like domain-containing protein n=1 Tax=Desulfobulbus alkaliphilus TaxID=869814 RepID=UPI001962328B|nr:rhodanese-like domain-containing protein [Desulfobulbus alkaliphilus]MBM9537918.1 rhodanese-like domain-containing protein [Desulfobulbus alkaliphilus]
MKNILFSLILATFLVTSTKAEDNVVAVIDGYQTLFLLQHGAAFIDNRPQHKFARGHIHGAVNLPYYTPDHSTNIMSKDNLAVALGGKDVAVFYCSGALRAYQAIRQAQEWGFTLPMYWYRNGWAEWQLLTLGPASESVAADSDQQE